MLRKGLYKNVGYVWEKSVIVNEQESLTDAKAGAKRAIDVGLAVRAWPGNLQQINARNIPK